MKVIGLTGMPGSGKTEVRNVLEGMGWQVVRMGDFIFREVEARGLELTPENIGAVADEMRGTHGPDIWAVRTVEHIRSTDAERFLIDGVRSHDECDRFRAELGDDFTVLAVLASPQARMERILGRGREDDGDEQSFIDRDAREIRWGVGKVIADSDLSFRNEGTLEDIRRWAEEQDIFK